MRVAVIYGPRNTPPPDLMPKLCEDLRDWIGRHRDRMETMEFFVAGGGFAVADVEESEELQRLVAEHPFTPFSEVEVRPVVNPDVGLQTLQEVFAARAASR